MPFSLRGLLFSRPRRRDGTARVERKAPVKPKPSAERRGLIATQETAFVDLRQALGRKDYGTALEHLKNVDRLEVALRQTPGVETSEIRAYSVPVRRLVVVRNLKLKANRGEILDSIVEGIRAEERRSGNSLGISRKTAYRVLKEHGCRDVIAEIEKRLEG